MKYILLVLIFLLCGVVGGILVEHGFDWKGGDYWVMTGITLAGIPLLAMAVGHRLKGQ